MKFKKMFKPSPPGGDAANQSETLDPQKVYRFVYKYKGLSLDFSVVENDIDNFTAILERAKKELDELKRKLHQPTETGK